MCLIARASTEVCHEIGNRCNPRHPGLDVRAGASPRDARRRHQVEASGHGSDPAGAADADRYRQCHGAGRAAGDPVGPRLARPLQWRDQRGSVGAHGGSHQGVPEGPRRQADRRAQSAGARRARGRGQETPGQCRLEDRVRCRHRRPARDSRKARPAAVERRQRPQMDLADRHHPDSDDQAQGGGADHRKACRTGEEGARGTKDRLQRGQAGFLRAVRHARAEEILPPRTDQRRGSPHPHHPVRPGYRRHHGAGGGGDVERLQSVSERRAGRRSAAAENRRIRHRHYRQRGRRDRHRPPGGRRLPFHRGRAVWECRSSGRGQGPRSRIVTHLRRARPETAGAECWCCEAECRAHRHRRSAEPGRRRGGEPRARASRQRPLA